MKYRLALDIGIASVGWAVLEHDEYDRPCRIVDLGVRKFTPPEIPKTGKSPAVDRRNARGIRRNLRRKRHRLDKIKAFLEEVLLSGVKIDFSPCDIYQLRVDALDRKISDNELARVVYSIFKHRGFKSNRKSEMEDKSNSKLLDAIKLNSRNSKEYRTIGEMYLSCEGYIENRQKIVGDKTIDFKVYNIRNKGKQYQNTLLREDVLNELKLILLSQKKFGNEKLTDDSIAKICHIFEYQKSYDEGPDAPSSYRVTFAVGNCTFFKEEKRAPKGSFAYEYFTALCDINHLKIDDKKLTSQQREILINAFLNKKEIKYKDVKKLLNLQENQYFNGKSGCNKDNNVFLRRKFSYEVMKILDLKDSPKKHAEPLDEIAFIFSMYKSDERRMRKLNESEITKALPENKKEELLKLETEKFGNLSIKALRLIIPYLEEGCVYSEACEKAGLKNVYGERMKKLKYNLIPEIEDLTSPVVKRSVSQTIKLVNAVIDKYGSPSAIFVELAREMGKDFLERKRIEKSQVDRFDENEKIKKRLTRDFGLQNPKPMDIVKFRLYEEQGGKCAYSCQKFEAVLGSVKAIFDNNNAQIDHIIPFSRCYDDSYNNKVLVLSQENQNKGNRLPFEYMGGDEKKWAAFVEFVESTYKNNRAKAAKLLKTSLSKEQEEELNSRALNDTRYIARFTKNLFQNYLIFAESSMSRKPVRTVNGTMTSFLRKIWKLPKERFEDDKHHAVDAAFIGCTDEGMVQRVTKFLKVRNAKQLTNGEYVFIDKSTGEIFSIEDTISEFGKFYQMPYENFKKELELRLYNPENIDYAKNELLKLGYTSEEVSMVKPMLVSRMVNHKVTGPMHAETVRSKKLFDENAKKQIAVTKTSIKELKLDKNNEIQDYPLKFKNDDTVLYNALRERLLEFNGDGAKAFAEPFYKPTKSGKFANQVKSVKLEKVVGDAIEMKGGIVENGDMIRIDIFEKSGKNYLIPVYTIDFYNQKLPNKICKAHTLLKDWPKLDETYKFKFSLFQHDLLHIRSKKGFNFVPMNKNDKNAKKEPVVLNNLFVYYNGANRRTGSISVQTMDGKYELCGIGIQNLLEFEKYEIDLLGNIRKVDKEIRKEFKINKKNS